MEVYLKMSCVILELIWEDLLARLKFSLKICFDLMLAAFLRSNIRSRRISAHVKLCGVFRRRLGLS